MLGTEDRGAREGARAGAGVGTCLASVAEGGGQGAEGHGL